MFPKLIYPDAFDFGMPTASLIPLSLKGVDKPFIQKRAALFDDFLGDLQPRPGHSYIHLISVGGGETYAANTNGDFFNKTAGEHKAPAPCSGAPEVLQLDGGLDKYHDLCFTKYAAVYKHHQNKHKKGKPSGYIHKAAMNHEMNRGELIIGVETDKWENELQKLASDEPIYFSMGAECPYDICSYCHNKARSRSQYCRHFKEAMLSIDKDGNQVFAITDVPLFHDISGVVRPADKIAFGLRKVAAEGRVIGSAELAELAGMVPNIDMLRGTLSKQAARQLELLEKLAKIEKELLACPADSPEGALIGSFAPETGFGDIPEPLMKKLRLKMETSPGAVLGALKKRYVVMPIETFFKLIMGDQFGEMEALLPDARRSLPGILQELVGDPGVDSFLADGSYEPSACCDPALDETAARLAGDHGLDNEPVRMRSIKAVLRAAPTGRHLTIIKEGASRTGAGPMLAREYARYLMSFAEGLDEKRQHLTVAQMLANVM